MASNHDEFWPSAPRKRAAVQQTAEQAVFSRFVFVKPSPWGRPLRRMGARPEYWLFAIRDLLAAEGVALERAGAGRAF